MLLSPFTDVAHRDAPPDLRDLAVRMCNMLSTDGQAAAIAAEMAELRLRIDLAPLIREMVLWVRKPQIRYGESARSDMIARYLVIAVAELQRSTAAGLHDHRMLHQCLAAEAGLDGLFHKLYSADIHPAVFYNEYGAGCSKAVALWMRHYFDTRETFVWDSDEAWYVLVALCYEGASRTLERALASLSKLKTKRLQLLILAPTRLFLANLGDCMISTLSKHEMRTACVRKVLKCGISVYGTHYTEYVRDIYKRNGVMEMILNEFNKNYKDCDCEDKREQITLDRREFLRGYRSAIRAVSFIQTIAAKKPS